jgi:hypothetical protein
MTRIVRRVQYCTAYSCIVILVELYRTVGTVQTVQYTAPQYDAVYNNDTCPNANEKPAYQ